MRAKKIKLYICCALCGKNKRLFKDVDDFYFVNDHGQYYFHDNLNLYFCKKCSKYLNETKSFVDKVKYKTKWIEKFAGYHSGWDIYSNNGISRFYNNLIVSLLSVGKENVRGFAPFFEFDAFLHVVSIYGLKKKVKSIGYHNVSNDWSKVLDKDSLYVVIYHEGFVNDGNDFCALFMPIYEDTILTQDDIDVFKEGYDNEIYELEIMNAKDLNDLFENTCKGKRIIFYTKNDCLRMFPPRILMLRKNV